MSTEAQRYFAVFLERKAMAMPYVHRDQKPMSFVLGRNFKARTTKFRTHVDEHRVMRL